MGKKKIKIIAYVILIFLFVLLSLDFYLSKDYYVPSSDIFLADPLKYAGKETELTGPVLDVMADSFYLDVNQRPLKIYYPNFEKPVLGQAYVRAKLNSDGTATGLEVHNLSYNYIKYAISFLAFILFLFIFFKEWKFRKWRLVENA